MRTAFNFAESKSKGGRGGACKKEAAYDEPWPQQVCGLRPRPWHRGGDCRREEELLRVQNVHDRCARRGGGYGATTWHPQQIYRKGPERGRHRVPGTEVLGRNLRQRQGRKQQRRGDYPMRFHLHCCCSRDDHAQRKHAGGAKKGASAVHGCSHFGGRKAPH